MKRFGFYYDVVCPYAYLASTQVQALAGRCGAEVEWKPFLLGGVFRAIGAPDSPAETMSVAKQRHNFIDMKRWAVHFGVPLEMPAEHPRRTVLALRALLAAGEAARVPASEALFRAYWCEGRDLADPRVVAEVLNAVGVDGAACVSHADTPEIKADLRARTDEAIALGIFGAPSFVVGDELFWGQDRLLFVEKALRAL